MRKGIPLIMLKNYKTCRNNLNKEDRTYMKKKGKILSKDMKQVLNKWMDVLCP